MIDYRARSYWAWYFAKVWQIRSPLFFGVVLLRPTPPVVWCCFPRLGGVVVSLFFHDVTTLHWSNSDSNSGNHEDKRNRNKNVGKRTGHFQNMKRIVKKSTARNKWKIKCTKSLKRSETRERYQKREVNGKGSKISSRSELSHVNWKKEALLVKRSPVRRGRVPKQRCDHNNRKEW